MCEQSVNLIGDAIGGTFSHFEGDGAVIVYGSHTFPSYRIEVQAEVAERVVDEIAERIRGWSCAD